MEDQMELMKNFPLLLPSDNLKTYEGIIHCEGFDFWLMLRVPSYPSLCDINAKFSCNVGYLLQNHKQTLKEWSAHCSLLMFLENLKHLLESLVKDKLPVIKEEYIRAESFRKISTELDEIGMKHIVSLSSNLGCIKLKIVDEANREHFLEVDCSNNYPHQPPQIIADLPEYSVKIIKQNMFIVDIFNSFIKEIDSLQKLWNILDVLDSSCWILDPENPTKKDTGRRILISKSVSILVQINLQKITSIPGITFLGPEQAVEPFQQHLIEHQQMWNQENSIVDNLRLVLGLETLMKKANDEDEESLVREGECCICYATHLDGQLPSEICEDERCSSAFHSVCLFQWLQSVAGNYQSFNRIHGACPNCSMVISCPVPS